MCRSSARTLTLLVYVGMIRGRHHNEAIIVAATQADIREALASVMLRGKVEATVDDSIGAARNELGQAAHLSRERSKLRRPSESPTSLYVAGGGSVPGVDRVGAGDLSR